MAFINISLFIYYSGRQRIYKLSLIGSFALVSVLCLTHICVDGTYLLALDSTEYIICWLFGIRIRWGCVFACG